MRIGLPTDLISRDGTVAQDAKDARIKNGYVESRGEQSVVRKRPVASGDITAVAGTAQGGIGINIGGVDYLVGFWGDTDYPVVSGEDWTQAISSFFGSNLRVYENFAEWNPDDKNPNLKLINNNLTFWTSVNNIGISCAARANTGVSSGKWYWECTLNPHPVGSIGMWVSFGVGTIDASLVTDVGRDEFAWGYYSNIDIITGPTWGRILHNDIELASVPTYTVEDVIGIALDMDAGTVSFYKNGTLIYTATGLTGEIFPIASITLSGAGGPEYINANFGSSPFSFTPPANYKPGIYT